MLLIYLKKTLTPCTNKNKYRESSIFVWAKLSIRYIGWQPTSGVLEESYSGNLMYLLKYIVEWFYGNKDKISVKYP